jgi:uncharacterized protein YutE (UPF0331/DUF86 family)
MVDEGRLRRLFDRLRDETDAIRTLAEDAEALRHDATALAAVKYRFIVAIEACIDVGEHVIASEQLPAPDTFADVFRILADAGWVDAEHVPAWQDMARFRNLLVHLYDAVDDDRVVEIARTRLEDLDEFRREMASRVVAES